MSYASTFFRNADLARLSKRFPALDWRGDSNDEKPAHESGAFGANIVERNSQQREFACRVLETYILEQNYNDAQGQTAQDFAEGLFEFEYCAECHGDIKDHTYVIFFGHWFARCKREHVARCKVCSQVKGKENEEPTDDYEDDL